MSKRAIEKEISKVKNKKLKMETSVDEAKTEIVNKFTKQINEVLEDPAKDKDSIDGLETASKTFQPLLDEFKDLISENKDKKPFIGGQIKMFTILLSSGSKHNSSQNLKSHKNKHKNCTRLMPRTKATARRLRRPIFIAAQGQRIGNKNIMNKRNSV